ncbi:MAG: NUDIX hydrolase [Candidatus Gastranaerophilales bacterium]|nr:NUDIX hydrolase [Candidatus Gastranaerophilales bacterium]
MSNLEEKFISTERLLDGAFIHVKKDQVLSPKGECFREVVEHPGGVVIVPFLDEDNVIFIRQWRYPVGEEIIEFPAGKLEINEDPFECAKRELIEETGYKANSWESLGFVYSTPGFCSEKLYLYRAKDLEFVGTNFDEFETVESFTKQTKNIPDMIKMGKIVDAKTICAVYKMSY